MLRKQNKGRLFFFLFFAAFFLLGGPTFAKESGGIEAPTAVLRAKTYVYSGEAGAVAFSAEQKYTNK